MYLDWSGESDMADDAFFNYRRLQYDLTFDDVYSLTQVKSTGIIDYLFDEVFEVATDALMFNRYLLVLSMLDNKRNIYLDGIVGEIYDSFMLSIHTDIDDLGYYCQMTERYIVDDPTDPHKIVRCSAELDFLVQHESAIKHHMSIYTYLLFTNIYHNVYQFIQQAGKAGITFSSLSHRQCPITQIRTIVCYTNPEVVKNHDPAWYDRLSLLHSV